MSSSDRRAEWHTPSEIVEPIERAVGGFDMDTAPRSRRDSPVAEQPHETEAEALEREWSGTVWSAPSGDMAEWSRKFALESRREGVDLIVAIVRGDSSTRWWHDHALEADVIAFRAGRIGFGGEGSAAFPSHILVFGEAPAELIRELSLEAAVVPTEAILSYGREESAQAALSLFAGGDRSGAEGQESGEKGG